MSDQEPRRVRFDLRAAVILGFLSLVGCFVAWKWTESRSREGCVNDLRNKGAFVEAIRGEDVWSKALPFRSAARLKKIWLVDGLFDDDDVLRLRRTFPGIQIFRVDMTTPDSRMSTYNDLVESPK